MDTKRTNTTPKSMKSLAAEALGSIESFKFHVIKKLNNNGYR
jgi:hypothetical protein